MFLSTTGQSPAPLGYSGLHNMLTAIGKATGLPVRAHQFRNTAATGWARAKVDPDVIMALLGHRPLASASIYLTPRRRSFEARWKERSRTGRRSSDRRRRLPAP
nr:site-specific integrase [Arthrobacter globiformis]